MLKMELEESIKVSSCEQLNNEDDGILKNSLSEQGSLNEMEKECVGVSGVNGDDDANQQVNPCEEKERCVVCQKIISESSHPGSSSGSLFEGPGPIHGKEMPKAVVRANFLASLNGIWPYLQTFWRKQNWEGEGEDNEDDLDWSRVFGIEIQRSRIFSRVPTVCQLCADKVQAVSDLMQGLKSHLRELRKIILESKKDNSRLFSEVRCPKEEIASESDEGSFGQLEDVPTPSTSKQSSPSKITRRSERSSKFDFDAKHKRMLSTKEKMKTSKRKKRSTTARLDNNEHSKLSSDDLNEVDDIKVENLDMDELADLEDFPDLVGSPANQSNEEDNDNLSAASPAPSTPAAAEEQEDDDDDDTDDKTWNGEDEEDEANNSVENSGDSNDDDDDDDNYSSSESDEEYTAPTTIKRGRKPVQKEKSPKKSKAKQKSTSKSSSSTKKPFKCEVTTCKKSFTTNRRLTYHQKRNHPDKYPISKTYNCTCGKIFTTSKGRLAHLRTSAEHKGEEIFVGKKRTVCDMCGQQETFDNLEAHVRAHVGDYCVKCPNAPQCQYVFTNFLAIPKHLERVKSCRKAVKSLDYSCESCEFKTDKQLMLRTHLILNHERTPENMVLPCPIFGCPEKFSVRQSVHYHLKTNHKMRQVSSQRCVECTLELKVDEMSSHLKTSHQAKEIINCPYCPCLFPGRVYLVDHLGMHKNESPTCDLCNDGVKFSRYAALREHYYLVHQVGVKEFICDECGKEFWNKNSLSLHIKLYHTGEYQFKKKTFPCEICYEPVMEFSSEDALICHKINMHGAEPFRCKICGVTFTAKAAFVRHERDHQGIRRKEYKCEVKGCEGKSFNSRKMLNQHNELVHEGVRYDCELCGKTYTSAKNLKKHHQNSHLKLRPFVCDVCGDRFVAKAVMIRHKLIHTGERPYVCAICGQRFRQPEVLKRHMDAHERKGEGFKPNGPMKQIRKRQGE